MFRRIVGWPTISLAILGFVITVGPSRAQQHETVFCIDDGEKIAAARFEQKDEKYFLYVDGNAEPLEFAAARVRGINVDPCPAPAQTSTQVPHFGVHGSNTIGERLMPMIIDAYGEKRFGSPAIHKPGAPEEEEITLKAGDETKAVIDFHAHGSGTAPKGLLNGSAVIGMASRRLKKEEADAIQARFNVDPLMPGNEHVLALDGLAVIVNPANPIKQLSLEQIARIFSGAVTNWNEVGGEDRPITVYRRDDKSGTYDTFVSLVLSPLNLKISPSATKFESSEQLSAAVLADTGGIGFIAVPYVGKNDALKIASNCGLTSAPSRFAIKSEEYPLARRLYLYTIGTPSEPVANDLLKFALSEDAQSIATDAGFYDLSVEFQDDADQRRWAQDIVENPGEALPPNKEIPSAAVRYFQKAMDNLRRSSMTFRFASGSSTLDTRAIQDIDRLANYLKQPGIAGRRFLIVGFADADGSWSHNQRLADQRAATVAGLLRKAGAPITRKNVQSLSYMAPVACNDNDAGKSKNRRVEVWIAP